MILANDLCQSSVQMGGYFCTAWLKEMLDAIPKEENEKCLNCNHPPHSASTKPKLIVTNEFVFLVTMKTFVQTIDK